MINRLENNQTEPVPRPELEGRLALPHHEFGLDVIAWIGAHRYQDPRTVAEIHQALMGQGGRDRVAHG